MHIYDTRFSFILVVFKYFCVYVFKSNDILILSNTGYAAVSRNWIYGNQIYGWGVPTIVLMVTAIMNLKQEHFGHNAVYDTIKYYSIAILWIINCVLLVVIIYLAIRSPSSMPNRNVLKYRYFQLLNISFTRMLCFNFLKISTNRSKLYFQLFMLTGFLWIFELLSWFLEDQKTTNHFFLVTDCVNALQGLFLFIVMVLLRLHVKRSIGGKGIYCIKFPLKWTQLEDMDDVELLPTA